MCNCSGACEPCLMDGQPRLHAKLNPPIHAHFTLGYVDGPLNFKVAKIGGLESMAAFREVIPRRRALGAE